ncbi:MAG: SusC/RagA family TonB-linked outer membrane protein [Longimicrobiales bacterium]
MRKELVMLALLWLASFDPLSAQERVVTGRVIDDAGRPLQSVEVVINRRTRGTITNASGAFRLEIPAGQVELTVHTIGYRMARVPVPEGVTDVGNITLVTDVLAMDELVITGHATGVQRRNLANAVATVSEAELAKTPAASIEQMMAGKLAGVDFRENSGAPGGGTRVRLRGMTSIIGSGEPLYVIDGVIVSNQKMDSGLNAISRAQGGQIASTTQMAPVNRVADLNPADIESVEVLKGASAAAIYGSKASNGVIIIQTKRGRSGAPQFQVRQSVGVAMRANSYHGGRIFKTLEDAVGAFGPQAANYWTPNYEVINLEDQLTGQKPVQYETSASVTGGTDDTRYFLSGLVRHEPGIAILTKADKATMRLNLDQTIGERFSMSAGMELLHTYSDRGVFGNDNSGASYYFVLPHHPNFFDLRPTCEDGAKRTVCDNPKAAVYPENPFVASNPFQTAALMTRNDNVWRYITNFQAAYEPVITSTQRLRIMTNGGFDEFMQKGDYVSPPELQFEDDDGLPGTRVLTYGSSRNTNVNLNVVHQYQTSSLSATTSAGAQYEARDMNVSRNAARGLTAGTANLGAGVSQSIEEVNETEKDFGVFLQEEVLLNERLLVTAGMRADRSSNNFEIGKYYLYPKAAASYRWPVGGELLSELKVRAAFGQTGNRPMFGQKFSNMNTTNVAGIGGTLISTAAGNLTAKPERQTEYEGGLDLQLFASRWLLELTGYQKVVTDLLLRRDLPASTGFSSEIFNGGKLRVRGFEAVVSGGIIQTADTRWTMGLNFALTRNIVLDLPVPPFRAGGSFGQGSIYIEEGKPATQWVAYDTVPGTGMDPKPKTVIRAQGNAEPKWTGGVSSTYAHKTLTISTTLEAQKGGIINQGTWRHWDQQKNGYDHEEIDPNTGLSLGDSRRRFASTVPRTYSRDASYLKLRELRVGWEIPTEVRERVWGRIRSATVSLSARDMFTWKKIMGGNFLDGNDPTVANYNSGDYASNNVQFTREFAAYPSSRSFWLQFDLGF